MIFSGLISFAGNTTKLISAYDQFACELENAVMAVFNGDNYEITTDISIEHKLLKECCFCHFANKLYVENFYLKNKLIKVAKPRISPSFHYFLVF